MNRIHLLIITLLFIAGCSSSKPEDPANIGEMVAGGTTANAVVQEMDLTLSQIKSFTMRSSMLIKSPQINQSVTAKIGRPAGDSLYIKITALLGIEAARMLVTSDSFYVHDRINKRLVYGALNTAGEFLPGPTSLASFDKNLLGRPVIDNTIDWQLTNDSTAFYLTSADQSKRYTLLPSPWHITKYESFEGDHLVEVHDFEDFEINNGILIPTKVTFRQPVENIKLMFRHRSIEINPADVPTFNLPTDVKKVLMGAPSTDG